MGNPLTKSLIGLCLSLVLFFHCAPSHAQQSIPQGPDANPIKLVTMITEDDLGRPLKFPSFVFFDDTMEELYVINGGQGRIVIYGPDFFPRLSIGPGRGIESPEGIYVDQRGRVYVCQGRSMGKPPRITVLNPALFVEKEITFSGIEGAEAFVPRSLVKGINGNLYVAGMNSEGVLVFDEEGKFLRRLSPKDKVWREHAEASREVLRQVLSGAASPTGQKKEESPEEKGEDVREELLGLPPELIPKIKKEKKEEEKNFRIAPVKVIDIVRDPQGHLYLLSEETSKVYVYSPSEELLFSFGQKGGSSGKMSRPRSLAVDVKQKMIYVVDYMRHTVLIYDMTGRFLHEFGGLGWGPGWFNYPSSIVVDRRGRTIIADLFNQRVQVLEVKVKAKFPIFGPKVTGPRGGFPVPKDQEKKEEETEGRIPEER